VLIVEDHGVVLWGLKKLIDGEAPLMSVVASAGNRLDALAAARRTRPDVVLLDLTLGDESGLDFLPQLRDATGSGRVLVLTGLRDAETLRATLRRGASGVVCKDEQAEVVLKDKNAHVAYSNFARVTATPEEVSVDFALNPNPFQAGRQEVDVSLRLIMNFYTAKRLFSAMGMTLQRHEQTFGPIELDIRRRAVGGTPPVGGGQPPKM